MVERLKEDVARLSQALRIMGVDPDKVLDINPYGQERAQPRASSSDPVK
jgi:hypothetical protein